jgi:hypothetical protein
MDGIKPHVSGSFVPETEEKLQLLKATQNILDAWHTALFLAKTLGQQDLYDELAAVFGISGITEAPRLTEILRRLNTDFLLSSIETAGK